MKRLVQGRAFPDGSAEPVIPSVLAGTSSGALSVVALNAILLSEGLIEGRTGSGSFTWGDYENLIRGLNNDDVYESAGLISRALEIVRQGAILDTAPLRRFLKDFIGRSVGFRHLGDLPIKTYISVVERDTGIVHRLSSTTHPDLPLVDVLMASTAIPVAFPAQELRLRGHEPPVPCIDGGIGIDGIPVEAIRAEGCSRIFVIRPMKYDPQKKWSKVPPLARFQIVANAVHSFLYYQEALLDSALCRAVLYASEGTYVYLPELPYNFSLLDFESGGEQIDETEAWAERRDSGPAIVPVSR
jgi:predicted acylesterase/phospholipase RssA